MRAITSKRSVYLRTRRSAISLDSDPVQAKKDFCSGSGAISAIFLASSTSDGAMKVVPTWMILWAWSQRAFTYSGWEWPRVTHNWPD